MIAAPTPLCQLAGFYNCDKCPAIRHSYTPFYHKLFAQMPVFRLLELGVYLGASLKMWRDYFPQAEIFGIDIRPEYMLFDHPRITTMQADVSSGRELSWVAHSMGGNFDVIIDDATHEISDQATAIAALMPLLAPRGLYIIEDVANPESLTEMIGYRHKIYKFNPPDDNLIIAVRGSEV